MVERLVQFFVHHAWGSVIYTSVFQLDMVVF